MVKKFRHHFSLAALLMVVVLLAGCIGTKEEFTLNITVALEGEGNVEDVALSVDGDVVEVNADGKATVKVAKGDVEIKATLEGYKSFEDTINVTKDQSYEIILEVEEEPVDPEPVADEEAAAVVDAQITALDKEVGLDQYKSDVEAARAAYEALNAETKALVTKLALLEAHEDQLYELLYGEVTEFVIAEKVMDGIDLTADVLEDITLGSSFTYDGTVYQVTWESDKPEIIGADGTVNRPYGDDVEVTLTATLDFIGALSADQKNVFEIKLNVVGIRFDLAVENGSVTATLNDLTGLDAVTADDFAITFAIADEAVEAEDLKVEYKDGVATWTFTPFERGLEDYKVDIAVTFGEFEEKDSLEFVGLAVIVETVGAINKNGVTVTFEALEEALEGVTVTVIDPEGNEVEVEAQDLEEGATSAEFAFVEALEKDPTTGVWTVSGVTYDFDEFAAVAKVREATNLVELWEALQSDYFTGAVEENIKAYYNAADKSKLVTAEDVNKMIADVNASLVDAETVIKPIVDAIKANNELQLLSALQNDAFTDVYSELIVKYKEKLDAEDFFANADIAKIQKTIFEANVSADKEALTLGDVSKVTEDLELPAKGKYGTTITWKAAENQEYLTDEGKVTRPSAVDNDATVTLTATIAIGEDEARVTETKQITVTIKALDKAKSIYAFEYDLPENLVAEEEAVVDVTFKAVENLGEGYDNVRFAFVIEGPEGAEVTVSATDSEGNPYNSTIAADGEEKGYWGPPNGFDVEAAYDETTPWTVNFSEAGDYTITFSLIDATSETEEVVNGITETVTVTVDKAYVVRVNEATTAEEMRTALTALALAEDVSDYINLSSQGKLEVAELVLADRADEEDEEFATKQDAIVALGSSTGGAIKARAKFIDGVNAADSINAMKTALDKAQLPEFQALGALEKVEVAELVYNALNAFEAGEQFETIAQIREAAGL